MGLLIDVIKTNALEDHPSLSLSHCINRKQKHLSCTACMDICPKGVYDRKQKTPPEWNACQNCGLCVSACPSRCIAPSPSNAKRHLLLAEKTGEIVLSCRRAENAAGHVEECLSLVPWEMLAYLALGGKLILNLRLCRDCPMDACLDLLEEQLYKLKCFLGEEAYAQHVNVCFDSLPPVQGEGMSRRAFFSALRHGGQKTAALVVNDLVGEKVDAMIYRRLLASRVREMAQRNAQFSCRMALPWIKKECFGCGICALLCPNGAIGVGEEQEGVRSIYITPHKCTGCGVCKEVCRDGCIEQIGLMQLPHMDRLLLAQVSSCSCEDCGRAISPRKGETLCVLCRQKRRK